MLRAKRLPRQLLGPARADTPALDCQATLGASTVYAPADTLCCPSSPTARSATSWLAGAPSDEIIQVEGGLQSCIAALRGVATLLRGWHIKQALGLGGAGMQVGQEQLEVQTASCPSRRAGASGSIWGWGAQACRRGPHARVQW